MTTSIKQTRQEITENSRTENTAGAEIETGRVLRAGPGFYDVEVLVDVDNSVVTCTMLSNLVGYVVGATLSIIPPEGVTVKFIRNNKRDKYGYIIGCVNVPLTGDTVLFGNRTSLENKTNTIGEQAYIPIKEYLERKTILNCGINKSQDVLPGDFVIENELGVLLGVMKLVATLKASEKAKIETFLLDDLVRIISGQYRHSSAFGDFQIYNDNGKISVEWIGTSHQQETFGSSEKEFNTPFIKDDYNKLTDDNSSLKTTETKGIALKPRFEFFLGELGSFIHTIICSPMRNEKVEGEEKEKFETFDSKFIHSGLFQQHVDDSGRCIIRSANGIMLQRADRIPVPKKLKEAWDPTGDKETDELKKEPYKHSEGYPWLRSAHIRDANAWFMKQVYAPFDKRPSDWSVPEDSELPALVDEYDRIHNNTAEFKKNHNKQSYIHLEDDGSIVLRDNWGSEIYMRGGNIIISCPGQLEFRSGRSTVVLAGHDLVAKAKESVDITATNHDARLICNKNLQLGSINGGVLIESKVAVENSKRINYKEVTGENINSAGVVIKSTRSTVFIIGKTLHLSGLKNIILEAVEELEELASGKFKQVKGYIDIAARNIRMLCTTYLLGAVETASATAQPTTEKAIEKMKSGIIIDKAGNLGSFGKRVVMSSKEKNGVVMFENDGKDVQKGLVTELVKLDAAEAAKIPGTAKSGYAHKALQRQIAYGAAIEFNSDSWLGIYTPYALADNKKLVQRPYIGLSFRTEAQYGTLEQSEISDKLPIGVPYTNYEKISTQFLMYLSPWQYYYYDEEYKITAGWSETALKGTSPWPGVRYYDPKDPVKMYVWSGESNVGSKRSELINGGVEVDLWPLGKYVVMKHQGEK